MSELKERILQKFFPEYTKLKRIMNLYSDYELCLASDNLPDDVDDLEREIVLALQWDIKDVLLQNYINDWNDFYYEHESEIMDYFFDGDPFISYDLSNYFYCISENTVIDVCKELISGLEEKYSINTDVDFREIISNLNKWYPVKFCEV